MKQYTKLKNNNSMKVILNAREFVITSTFWIIITVKAILSYRYKGTYVKDRGQIIAKDHQRTSKSKLISLKLHRNLSKASQKKKKLNRFCGFYDLNRRTIKKTNTID